MVMIKKIRKQKIKDGLDFLIVLVLVLVLNLLSTQYFVKIDLTKEKRYTLSPTTKNLAEHIETEIFIKVYLEGNLSARFKRLRTATLDMLLELRDLSGKQINFEFIDPFEGKNQQQKQDILKQFEQKGLRPYDDIDDVDFESQSRNLIFPGAEVTYGMGKRFSMNLLKTEMGMANEENVNQSIENLEYEFAQAIRKCKSGRNKKIGFLQGHGELDEMALYDLKKELGSFYRTDAMNISIQDLDNIAIYEEKFTDDDLHNARLLLTSLQNKINQYDAVIVAKPTSDISREEAFLIDQYILNGGKMIWMLDALQAEMDSMGKDGQMVCIDYPSENIRELLFNYGIRVNMDLLQDLRCNDIPLRDPYSGNAYKNFPWVYYPIFVGHPKLTQHPISKNIEGVWGRFGGTLTGVKRENMTFQPLLLSSDKTKISKSPALVSYDVINKIRAKELDFLKSFNQGYHVTGALIEGEFKSSFSRRIGVRSDLPFIDKGKSTLIVISDGDICRNHVNLNGGYLELGKDHMTGRYFGNKKFLLNCVDYLIDDLGLIEIRSKEIILRLLDREKVKTERRFWQWLNIFVPVIAIIVFGLTNSFIRKKRYAGV
jgi:ABC-2 type transport system permease protein